MHVGTNYVTKKCSVCQFISKKFSLTENNRSSFTHLVCKLVNKLTWKKWTKTIIFTIIIILSFLLLAEQAYYFSIFYSNSSFC